MTNKMIGVSNMKTLKMITMLAASMCVGVFMLGCTDAVPTESAIQINNTKPKQSNVEIVNLGADQDVIKQINMELNSNPPAAGGKTYYVCNTGNDENTGLSESSPFRSYEKAMSMFATISGGDSVLFCRGGQFPVSKAKAINNMSCSISSPCILGDYGDSTADKPLITVSDASKPIWFADGGTKTPDAGYIVKNLSLVSTTGQAPGVFLYRGVNNILLDNLHIQGFKLGIQIADSSVHTVTLSNSVILNSVGQGILGACNDCIIENNHFENNGKNLFHHNIYLSSNDGIAKNVTVRGNTLYKAAMQDGKCSGVSLVAHGKFEGITIENNLIKEDIGAVKGGCYGISVDPGYGYEEYFKDVVIRGNTLLNVGGNAIGCASCDGALIENNTIIDEGSVLVHGISVPVRTEDSVKSKNITIRNNKILLTKNWNQTSGVRVGGLHPMTAENNTVYLADYPLSVCVRGSEKNLDVDDSSNTCKKTVSPTTLQSLVQSLLSDSSADTAIEETVIEETAIEETAIEETVIEETVIEETAIEEVLVIDNPRNNSKKSVSNSETKKSAFTSTTYKAGSLFSSGARTGGGGGSITTGRTGKCQLFARGQCLM
jgi:hypothetical protein